MTQTKTGLQWTEQYSVGVSQLDEQHKKLFVAINGLIDVINSSNENISREEREKRLNEVISSLLEYKKNHFETEEKYFKEFNFEGAKNHIAKHQEFSEKLLQIKEESRDDIFAFSFTLVDFLEDWLIEHLMTLDQEYRECFKNHGLK